MIILIKMVEGDILLKYYFDRNSYDFDIYDDKISITLPMNRVKLGVGEYVSFDKDDIDVVANDYGIKIWLDKIDRNIIIPLDKKLDKSNIKATYRNGILNIEGKLKKVK